MLPPFPLRCLVSWLCTGGAPLGPAHLPWGQWGGPAGGDHQGEGRGWAGQGVGLRDGALVSDPSLSLQVLGTPTREQIREMNPNYTEFKFPQIKAHPWTKVGQG